MPFAEYALQSMYLNQVGTIQGTIHSLDPRFIVAQEYKFFQFFMQVLFSFGDLCVIALAMANAQNF